MTKITNRPLADLMRPESLEEIIGQDHLFLENAALRVIAETKNVPSIILWGPTGVGKTTIAKALAKIADAEFVAISAIDSGAAEIRKIVDRARKFVGKTILMIDEIHHFNKTQQDLFLPFVEDGTITLIGTTTENPSFYLNSALLSRCKVVTLKILDEDALEKILQRVEEKLGKKLPLNDEARQALISLACGDARYLLNACEELFALNHPPLEGQSTRSATEVNYPPLEGGSTRSATEVNYPPLKGGSTRSATEVNHPPLEGGSKSLATSRRGQLLDVADLQNLISKRAANFDKKGDVYYNLISAFHKSLRGSDVDAALYYLARMIVAGQDPYYILRRLARFATEDIGLADPNALLQVMAAKENYDFLGSPEGDYALSHATIYCATAPKSNASYLAHKAAIAVAENSAQISPPKNILNAPTKMMKEQGFGKGYIYDHDTPNCFSGQEFFPEELLEMFCKKNVSSAMKSSPMRDLPLEGDGGCSKTSRPQFYKPNERGFERELKKRLQYWNDLRKKLF